MSSIRTEIDRAARKAGYGKRQDLAAKLKLAPGHVSDLLNGNRDFTPEMMQAFIRLLKVPPATAKRWHQWGAKTAGWRI
jgi:plasmid maintenance system antidote protein VapI